MKNSCYLTNGLRLAEVETEKQIRLQVPNQHQTRGEPDCGTSAAAATLSIVDSSAAGIGAGAALSIVASSAVGAGAALLVAALGLA